MLLDSFQIQSELLVRLLSFASLPISTRTQCPSAHLHISPAAAWLCGSGRQRDLQLCAEGPLNVGSAASV